MEALLVISAALAASELARGSGWRAGIPLGVVTAGTVYIYSLAGVVWTVSATAAVLLASRRVRASMPALPGFLLAAAIVVAPAVDQIITFAGSPFNNENGQGNLLHAVNPLEVLGVWFGYDFRFTPDPLWPPIIGVVVVVLAATVAP